MSTTNKLWEETLEVIATIKKIEKIEKTMDEFNEKTKEGLAALIEDADTILTDCIDNCNYRYPGIAKDIFEIWANSTDKKSVEQMFYELVGIEFSEYLDKCITNTCYRLLQDKIVEAEYVSLWNDGLEVRSKCKVNLNTREVFDFEAKENIPDWMLDTLNEEYIILSGIKYSVSNSMIGDGFWYI